MCTDFCAFWMACVSAAPLSLGSTMISRFDVLGAPPLDDPACPPLPPIGALPPVAALPAEPATVPPAPALPPAELPPVELPALPPVPLPPLAPLPP